MASMMKKAMIYLGLGPDEEYEQYDDYTAPAPVSDAGAQSAETRPAASTRPAPRPRLQEQPLVHPQASAVPHAPTGTVRPIASDQASREAHEAVRPATAPQVSAPPADRVAAGREPNVSSAVRTVGPANPMPHAVSPTSFNDAQEIGDRFKKGQPVIVNLQAVDRDLRRRLVDFSSGLCYAIAGKMERVADQVYLLTPADVEVAPEETRRHLD